MSHSHCLLAYAYAAHHSLRAMQTKRLLGQCGCNDNIVCRTSNLRNAELVASRCVLIVEPILRCPDFAVQNRLPFCLLAMRFRLANTLVDALNWKFQNAAPNWFVQLDQRRSILLESEWNKSNPINGDLLQGLQGVSFKWDDTWKLSSSHPESVSLARVQLVQQINLFEVRVLFGFPGS